MNHQITRAPSAISVQQARNLHLAAQGLLRPPRARATRKRLLAAIERMKLAALVDPRCKATCQRCLKVPDLGAAYMHPYSIGVISVVRLPDE